ncbi:hypothetical protein [Paenibacillus sp. DS2015]|uniref:hypothetical protein n=1 Tax=Paenibacillus sp. DS2015 TaxID=3373917 RepID=UPI003D1E6037
MAGTYMHGMSVWDCKERSTYTLKFFGRRNFSEIPDPDLKPLMDGETVVLSIILFPHIVSTVTNGRRITSFFPRAMNSCRTPL